MFLWHFMTCIDLCNQHHNQDTNCSITRNKFLHTTPSAIIFSPIFFFTIFSLLSFWDSQWMHVKALDIVPWFFTALFPLSSSLPSLNNFYGSTFKSTNYFLHPASVWSVDYLVKIVFIFGAVFLILSCPFDFSYSCHLFAEMSICLS